MAPRASARRSPRRPPARAGGARSGGARTGPVRMPFGRFNYVLLLVSVALVVIGYVVMAVDNRTAADPVFSPVSLTVVPVLLLAGYLGVVWALLSRRSDREDGAAPDATAAPSGVEAA